ncbi:MAG: hypothetical protein CGU28_16765 [Candidatus Dactylopiibacterium carminicum]|uniref:Polyprenol-phosphate-mannose--protein mannosyltransferase n=1 Tax=Candidatus Dactylopiibacterium carminicum TaxID=857335 RepID=A0A272EMM1_9RHOO|nr:phospholipid carrier-dependent glycosyltransferase [Candidatus Dactylopiibacterium carminicum]KAF7597759.1 hypothetical protein BGI27_17040 [Candidatus Dactylopiibacterium carminicum]PAS91364.1 MAG: hypothetical protein CGU29_16850 [Candidatus Dactylopiibacterium carminicum]PAS92341.1 MAG: hypothetical protein CGU28_16765 [Candidatus Dactylopiibacterium carminicum]PAS95248.1 MAG: hypothetical protein BSR46_17080 [Candidatus Dactylopiibacterium carminicum]
MAKPKNREKQPETTEQTSPISPSRIGAQFDAVSARIETVPAWLRTTLCMALVLIIGLMMYFAGHDKPPHAFWDENYHVTSAQRYIDGIAHMETHPPLGKLLIAAGEALTGANADIDKSALVRDKYISGDNLPEGFSFAGMRFMPSLFGAFAAVMFFGLMFALTDNRFIALLLSSLYLFENAFIVHFRAVHLDSFQMFFCLGALWLFVRLWKREGAIPWQQYAALGALCGLGIMVKVNAALLLALFPVLYFKDAGARAGLSLAGHARHFLTKSGAATAALAIVALVVFGLHGLIADQSPSPRDPAGQKDLAHMSATYKDYVNLHQSMTPSVLFAISRDYFNFMQVDNKGVPKLDVCKPGENGSHPMNWPAMNKTINYRWDSANGMTRYVQLVGNQFSWYLGLAAVLLSLLTIANHRLFKMPMGEKRSYQLIEVFTGLYVLFMLLHLYLGAQRVMYLYHYFIGLLISYILIVLNWQHLCDFHGFTLRKRTAIAAGFTAAIIASSLFFLPLSNHWPLTKQQCEARNIFSNVVSCQ